MNLKIKMAPDGRLIKHISYLCAHEGMNQWGVSYWDTYYPVANRMSIRAMLTMIILRELYTK